MRRPSGTWAMPWRTTSRAGATPTMRGAVEAHVALARGQQAGDGRSVVRLARAVVAESVTISPCATPERDALQGVDLAVVRRAGRVDLEHGHSQPPRPRPSRAAPEVRLDHARVALDVRGRALGDLLAVVEHGDAVGHLHHHAHVVLDEEDGEPRSSTSRRSSSIRLRASPWVHARGRLVEQQQRRARSRGRARSRAAAGRRRAGCARARWLCRAGRRSSRSSAPRSTAAAPRSRSGAAGDHVPEAERSAACMPDQHVLDGGHAREQADVLEGAADAERGDLVGAQPERRGVPAEGHGALLGHVDPGEDVEERRLAGPVGPDDRGDVPFLEREVDRVQGGQPAEALAHGPGLEQRHQGFSVSSRCRRFAGRMPWGRKIIMSTRMRPKTIRSYLAGSSWVGRLARS